MEEFLKVPRGTGCVISDTKVPCGFWVVNSKIRVKVTYSSEQESWSPTKGQSLGNEYGETCAPDGRGKEKEDFRKSKRSKDKVTEEDVRGGTPTPKSPPTDKIGRTVTGVRPQR